MKKICLILILLLFISDYADAEGWSPKQDARIYVDFTGIYVDGIYKEGDQSFIVDCANDPYLPNPVSDGKVWGITVIGRPRGVGVEVRNCIIEKNQLQPNTYGYGGIPFGGGLLMGPMVTGTAHHNTIRYNGSGPSPGSHTGAVDKNTSTEWRTHPEDQQLPHWYGFTLDDNTKISKVRVFTGTANRTWNVYFGPNTMWKPDVNPTYEEYKIITDASVGGTAGWVELTPTQVLTQQRLWILISGGPVEDHLFELQYEADGVWHTPALDEVISCGALKGGSAGVILRNTSDVQLHDNKIYDNANHAIGVRGAKGSIGPNNEIYESEAWVERDISGIWTIGIMDDVDLTIHDNDFHNLSSGIGMQYVSGNVSIAGNDFHDFQPNSTRGIGRQAMSGDLALNISNNYFWNNSKMTTIQMEQNNSFHMDFIFDANTITSGFTGMKMRYNDNADINITNNTISDLKRHGINLLDNGSPGTVTNITIASNIISDNERTGIRVQGHKHATVKIENNTLTGNSWNPPDNNNINIRDTLHFKGAEGCTFIISGNTISSSVAHPLIKDDGLGFKENTSTNVTISDNIISNHPGAGIKLSNNTGGGMVNISGNTVNNNDLIGIYFKDNELKTTTIDGNDITYNGLGNASSDWGGVRFSNNDNVHIEKNHFAYNTGIALRVQDSSNVFVGWKDWDPLNIDAPDNPRPGEPYCYPYPAGTPYYPKDTVPWCKYASNMRAVSQMSPCGLSYFDPDPDHSWDNADLWDTSTQRRKPGTGTNMFIDNTSWAIQIGAIGANVNNVKFQGNVVAGNGGPGFGFKGENGYTVNAEVYACTVTDNPGGDGIQVKAGATVKVNNSRVVGGDAVQTDGGHLDIYNGNQFNIKLRAIGSASANVYNYNYIGCINKCEAGTGSNKPSDASYNIEHYNCIGGHVPLDSDYMEIHDHNWFDAVDTFEMHEGGGIRLYNGNRLAGGLYRKNHSGPFQIGDCNATEPNYFPTGLTTSIRNGSVCGNWINGGSLSTGGPDGSITVRCNVGNSSVSGGSVTCSGNVGDWSPKSCETPDGCSYWSGENGWINFCAERNCMAPINLASFESGLTLVQEVLHDVATEFIDLIK